MDSSAHNQSEVTAKGAPLARPGAPLPSISASRASRPYIRTGDCRETGRRVSINDMKKSRTAKTGVSTCEP
jgi:hypothetical protein